MDAICVPFVIQMEGDEPPDLSGFVDPICIPARIVWLNGDGTPRAPEPTSTAHDESIPGNPPPGSVGTVTYARFVHFGEFQPMLDLLNTTKYVRGLAGLLRVMEITPQQKICEENDTLTSPVQSAAEKQRLQIAQSPLFLFEEPPALLRPPLENFPTDLAKPPGPGWEWKGKQGSRPGEPGGNWFNPATGESLRP